MGLISRVTIVITYNLIMLGNLYPTYNYMNIQIGTIEGQGSQFTSRQSVALGFRALGAWPVNAQELGGFWVFCSDRGCTIGCAGSERVLIEIFDSLGSCLKS